MRIPPWKPLLIIAVLGLAALLMYPPHTKLKPGLDLAGGATLVYEVEVPEDRSTQRVIEDTIAVLKKRVDPNGVRNLVWRPLAGNRIEIQMPAPPEQTQQLRREFEAARETLLDGNLSRRKVESLLRLPPEQREARLREFAGDHPERLAALQQLAQQHDRLAEAREPYLQTQSQFRAIEKALDEAPEAQREPLEQQKQALLERLQRRTETFLEAQERYEQAEQKVFAANVSPLRLSSTLSLLENPRDESAVAAWRENALAELIEDHPQREQALRAVADAWIAYAQVKGPLEDVEDLKALLQGSGVLEFRIAPSTDAPIDIASYRKQLEESGPRSGLNRPYRWFPIDDLENMVDDPDQLEIARRDPTSYFAPRLIVETYGGKPFVLLANTPDASITRAQEGWELESARPSQDRRGFRAVSFRLNSVGGDLMRRLTSNHVNQPMAIVLDGRVISAPNIQSTIGSQGVISGGRGGFSPEELDYLIRTLQAGSLEGRLTAEPISETTTGPQFGADNLRRGFQAAVWALILVAVFIALYYLAWGLLADFALLCNMILVLGIMAMLDATFTLPGIAGIVLTIGIAVDANVLIFERIREELEEGQKLRVAVRLGYQKAFSTIFDANVTTLITCLVLGYTATAEVKGFAVTLGIGILASMFTALFVTRVVVDFVLEYVKPTRIHMLPTLIRPLQRILSPNVPWLGKRRLLLAISAVAMAVSVVMVYERGEDLFDIEFRSGTQVTFELREGESLSLAEARRRLDEVAERMNEPELRGDRVNIVTMGQAAAGQASAFSISTLEQEVDVVSEAIKTAFSDLLDSKRPIEFAFDEAELTGDPPAPVYPVTEADLGRAIDRPDVQIDVGEFIGGVAIVLDRLAPAASVDDLRERIETMRRQPMYENLVGRTFRVFGIDLDPSGATDDDGDLLYRSAAVVVRDLSTNYVQNPDAFTQPDGLAATEWDLVRNAMQRDTSLGSVSNFSSQISGTMRQQAIVAILLSLLAVVVYIGFRFGSFRYGLASIMALVHDVTIALGLIAASAWVADSAVGQALLLNPFRIDLALIAALLTLIGYSLNDTIVVFDRIRENRGKLAVASEQTINRSINQTISRTLLTSGTTLLALLTLFTLGGPGVHGFAFAMIVGVLVGTYSSVAIACPFLLDRRVRKASEPASSSPSPAKT